MSLEDEHEVEQDERRRVVAALLRGGEAPDTPVPGPWAPLIAGLAVALALVLIVGMGTLVRAALPSGRPAPTAHPSPSASVTAHR
jgi:hypothetical protein